MKRMFDFVIALILVTVLSPLLAALAITVRLAIGSPVLFRHQRPGLNGKLFTLYKFRTMTDTKSPDGKLLPDSERMTSFGKLLRRTSLDELPELFNVLSGDMSLVGPRPLLKEYLPLYSVEQRRRHAVRPGITGWAQINGRNAATWQEKFACDIWYVDNRSLLVDLKILALTIRKVIAGEGVSEPGHVTTRPFEGNV